MRFAVVAVLVPVQSAIAKLELNVRLGGSGRALWTPKARRGHPLSEEDQEWNHTQNQLRAKGEHAFLIVKCLWNYRKVRYKGLAKNAAQVFSLFALANLYLVRKELMMIRG